METLEVESTRNLANWSITNLESYAQKQSKNRNIGVKSHKI